MSMRCHYCQRAVTETATILCHPLGMIGDSHRCCGPCEERVISVWDRLTREVRREALLDALRLHLSRVDKVISQYMRPRGVLE